MYYFNPRSRVGNDHVGDILVINSSISIHVPAWGTTLYPTLSTPVKKFQSTFPRGERRRYYITANDTEHFNPRSRVGNDCLIATFYLWQKISIHVPAWGTTIVPAVNKVAGKISIHVPAWGTTRSAGRAGNTGSISIHVPAWGTTQISLDSSN